MTNAVGPPNFISSQKEGYFRAIQRQMEPLYSWQRRGPVDYNVPKQRPYTARESRDPVVYGWVRHHPSKADTTTKFDPSWCSLLLLTQQALLQPPALILPHDPASAVSKLTLSGASAEA